MFGNRSLLNGGVIVILGAGVKEILIDILPEFGEVVMFK